MENKSRNLIESENDLDDQIINQNINMDIQDSKTERIISSRSQQQQEFCGWEVDDGINEFSLDFIKVLNAKLKNLDPIEETTKHINPKSKFQDKKSNMNNDLGNKENNIQDNAQNVKNHRLSINNAQEMIPPQNPSSVIDEMLFVNNLQDQNNKSNSDNGNSSKKIHDNGKVESLSFTSIKIQDYDSKNQQSNGNMNSIQQKISNAIPFENEIASRNNSSYNNNNNDKSTHRGSQCFGRNTEKSSFFNVNSKMPRKSQDTLSIGTENSQIINTEQSNTDTFSSTVAQMRLAKIEGKVLPKPGKQNQIKDIKFSNNNNNIISGISLSSLANSAQRKQNITNGLPSSHLKSFLSVTHPKKATNENNQGSHTKTKSKNHAVKSNDPPPQKAENPDPSIYFLKINSIKPNAEEIPPNSGSDLHDILRKSITEMKKEIHPSQSNPTLTNLKKITTPLQLPRTASDGRVELKSLNSQTLYYSNKYHIFLNNPDNNNNNVDKDTREGSLATKLVVENISTNYVMGKNYKNKLQEFMTTNSLDKYNMNQRKSQIEPLYSQKYMETIKELKIKKNLQKNLNNNNFHPRNHTSNLHIRLTNEDDKLKIMNGNVNNNRDGNAHTLNISNNLHIGSFNLLKKPQMAGKIGHLNRLYFSPDSRNPKEIKKYLSENTKSMNDALKQLGLLNTERLNHVLISKMKASMNNNNKLYVKHPHASIVISSSPNNDLQFFL